MPNPGVNTGPNFKTFVKIVYPTLLRYTVAVLYYTRLQTVHTQGAATVDDCVAHCVMCMGCSMEEVILEGPIPVHCTVPPV